MISNQSKVMITGASDGLGKALTLAIASKYNCSLAICGRSEEKLKSVIRDINEINPCVKVFAACFDVTDDECCTEFIQNSVEAIGDIDILINNAGANIKKDLVENIDLNDLRYMFNLNCASPLLFIQGVLPHMKEVSDGHIVNILSSVCKHSIENSGAYSASKDAMDILHKILLKEVRESHIKVTGIYPGGINTNFRTNVREDYMHPKTVANAILSVLECEDDAVVHELVLRPFVENNF